MVAIPAVMICGYHIPNPTGTDMQIRWIVGFVLLNAVLGNAAAAGRLVVEQAWVRAAPPGAMMLAGYALLRNTGDATLTVTTAASTDFADVSLHRSVEENGVERMVPLGRFDIAPGNRVEFAPGGRHFMLMRPQRNLKVGDKVKIHIDTEPGAGATVEFTVLDAAPAAG
jgi:periplasmic copper chaperone A